MAGRTLRHLDLIAHLPWVAGPPAEARAAARGSPQKIAGTTFSAALSDRDALLIGTGRALPSAFAPSAIALYQRVIEGVLVAAPCGQVSRGRRAGSRGR